MGGGGAIDGVVDPTAVDAVAPRVDQPGGSQRLQMVGKQVGRLRK
jgi:hypothetical protein